MQIIVVGLNHETAPTEIRERLSFTHDQLGDALTRLTTLVIEGVILSTCHRTEVYALVENDALGYEVVVRFMANYHHFPVEAFALHLYRCCDEEAVLHLFNVASGISSMIIGEPQILGQVRDAFKVAADQGAASRVLSALFRQAIHVGKRARTVTAIGHQALTTSHAAVALAREASRPLPLSGRRVLVIGAGSTGKLLVSLLVKVGVRKIQIANRTPERAVALAERAGGQGWGLEAVGRLLMEVDLVISATEAQHPIVTAPMVEAARPRLRERPLVLIDMGMPRDIDPVVKDSDGVILHNVDDLRAVMEDTLTRQRREINKVQEIVAQETVKYMTWFRSLEMVPTIIALSRKVEVIRTQELKRHASRLGMLSEAQQEAVEVLTTSIIRKILHQPTVRLKEYAGQHRGYLCAEVLHDLFALEVEGATEERR